MRIEVWLEAGDEVSLLDIGNYTTRISYEASHQPPFACVSPPPNTLGKASAVEATFFLLASNYFNFSILRLCNRPKVSSW